MVRRLTRGRTYMGWGHSVPAAHQPHARRRSGGRLRSAGFLDRSRPSARRHSLPSPRSATKRDGACRRCGALQGHRRVDAYARPRSIDLAVLPNPSDGDPARARLHRHARGGGVFCCPVTRIWSFHGTRIARINGGRHGTRIARINAGRHGTRIARINKSGRNGTRIARINDEGQWRELTSPGVENP